MEKSDALVLVSDGAAERFNDQKQMFGFERLLAQKQALIRRILWQ